MFEWKGVLAVLDRLVLKFGGKPLEPGPNCVSIRRSLMARS
ncbi:MAG: hypothetical protein ACM3U2_01870 [Deltaproteobacteria bacterium]